MSWWRAPKRSAVMRFVSHPSRREAQNRDEAAEEHGLAPMSRHEVLRPRNHALRPSLQPADAFKQRASTQTADDPVAEIVADDRTGGGNGNDLRDVVIALR